MWPRLGWEIERMQGLKPRKIKEPWGISFQRLSRNISEFNLNQLPLFHSLSIYFFHFSFQFKPQFFSSHFSCFFLDFFFIIKYTKLLYSLFFFHINTFQNFSMSSE